MQINQDSYYWLFSTTSQTIASFIAFLLTGFALVLNMMDTLQQKDESLTEIHEQLKVTYYRRMLILSVISGLAILFSIAMLYVNGVEMENKPFLFVFSFALSVLSISLAIYFVIAIINPNRYKYAAEDILKEEKTKFSITGSEVNQVNFMNAYLDLERKVRKLLKVKNILSEEKEIHSFRQLVTAMYENEMITNEVLYELLQINKYRNLVVHGHLDQVDEGMVDRVKKMQTELEMIV
jgi:hypothetical protein